MKQQAIHNEEESLVIDVSHIGQSLKTRFKAILLTMLSFACISCVASFTCYQEKFKSTGILLFNPTEVSPVVSSVNSTSHFLKEQGSEVSPYRNQEQLLKSRLIAERVFSELRKEHITTPVKSPEQLVNKVLFSEHLKGTDFIRVTAKASSPELAQKIAKIYINSYLSLINEISYGPLLQNKQLFEVQLKKAEQDLEEVNQRISDYQAQAGILNLEVESQDKVRELLSISTSIKDIEANLAQKKAEISNIRGQLKINRQDIGNVLQAVANGQDSILNELQQKLEEAQKEYDTKVLVFAPTNPEMLQLQRKIDVIERQMTDQRILSVGNTSTLKMPHVIKDSVRTDLVNRLALSESEVAASQSKLRTLRYQYQQMDSSLQSLPKRELEYARLQLERKSKEELFTKLKADLTEIQIQEAAIRKKLIVIDQPAVADHAEFPRRFHIVGIAMVAGALLSILVVTGLAIRDPKLVCPYFIEKVLSVPLLAVIPWLSDKQWRYYRERNYLEVNVHQPDLKLVKAYQDLALNLKVQRNISGNNAIVVSSLFRTAGGSVILSNLAYCLAQSGDSVLLVDANLHSPHLHESFNHLLSYENGLTELINDISEMLYYSKNLDPADLQTRIASAAIPSGVHPQLHYLNAGLQMQNTFEFLNSKGFSTLIAAAKTHYQWVLLDAPPFLEHPDAAVLLSYTDGLLLLTEREATEDQMLLVHDKVQRLNANIIGAVLRGGSFSK